MLRRLLLLLLVLGAGQLVACGADQSPVVQGSTPATTVTTEPQPTTTTTSPVRTFAQDATTADAQYRITLTVGERTTSPLADECPPAQALAAGNSVLRVSITVANPSTTRAAPFPPLRVEMTGPGGRQEVLVRDPTGTCSFTPKVALIGPGETVVFKGTTPAIADSAAPGSAGQVEVSISENRFSLVAPVP